jgi:hypothetical protein
MMDYKGYTITKTACYPNAYHVEPVGFKSSNATCYFHPTVEAAKRFIDKQTLTPHK